MDMWVLGVGEYSCYHEVSVYHTLQEAVIAAEIFASQAHSIEDGPFTWSSCKLVGGNHWLHLMGESFEKYKDTIEKLCGGYLTITRVPIGLTDFSDKSYGCMG